MYFHHLILLLSVGCFLCLGPFVDLLLNTVGCGRHPRHREQKVGQSVEIDGGTGVQLGVPGERRDRPLSSAAHCAGQMKRGTGCTTARQYEIGERRQLGGVVVYPALQLGDPGRGGFRFQPGGGGPLVLRSGEWPLVSRCPVERTAHAPAASSTGGQRPGPARAPVRQWPTVRRLCRGLRTPGRPWVSSRR